ncbi:MAG: ATP-dependent helicase [Treponema sp.]|nr:ATP-dependent helicase [Treponema sp.]
MTEQLPSYLDVLNDEQRRAVLHTGNPLLILAGAGSGKTRVITTKIAWLIREQGVDPRSILAVTFTNKAAREMAERARLIDERASNAMLRTFHSFGAWFLRRNGAAGGLSSNFVIYDDDDSLALLAAILEGEPRAELRSIANSIARAKDYFLSPDDPEIDLIDPRAKFRTAYAQYEERLNRIGNVDFGDLIKKPVEILRGVPEVARRFRERFRVIMVDEYQDANIAQSQLLSELYSPGAYLCVVGDDDQSIYSFRGAEVQNILDFPETFANSDIVRLERNYRSTAPILRAAASVVDHNTGRLGKTLRAERGDGKMPVLAFLPDQDEEAAFCAELIGTGTAGKNARAVPYSDWAIVYRTNAQSLGFETEFLRRKIPYRVVGSLKFYEREEVKDTLALLSFLVNPRDEVAFRRMVNKPSRGVGPATVSRIIEKAMSLKLSVNFDTQPHSAQGANLALTAQSMRHELSSKAGAGIAAFLKAVEAGRAMLAEDSADNDEHEGEEKPASRKPPKSVSGLRSGEGLSACVVALAEESGIAEYHLTNDEISGNQRLANLQEVANAASLYAASQDGLLEFLEHIELDRSMGENAADDNNAVTLITLHNTKGLEFRRVIMTGIEQGIFPRDDKHDEDLEEERRLFYVGATRAMDELYLTSCAERRMYGRTSPMEPSVFLREIDRDTLRIVGNAPYGFAAGFSATHSANTDGAYTQRRGEQLQRGYSPNGYPQNKASSDGRWSLGDKVYHDDNGYGYIQQIRESADGPVVKVRFESGQEKQFLSHHQSSHYTKIRED